VKYRDRFIAAREAMMKEERAMRALLVADNSTRAAVDAQIIKTEAVRSALLRVRLDMLWDLRSVIPATNRAAAFRCAELLLLRRR
jgi:Spy/CpxP family protein refolding chaperone